MSEAIKIFEDANSCFANLKEAFLKKLPFLFKTFKSTLFQVDKTFIHPRWSLKFTIVQCIFGDYFPLLQR